MNHKDEDIYENLNQEKINVAEMDNLLLVSCKYHANSYLFWPLHILRFLPPVAFTLLSIHQNRTQLFTSAFSDISNL